MSNFFSRNINGILGTILFHMIIIIIGMAFQIQTITEYDEPYMLISTEFIDELTKPELDEEQREMDDIAIEQFINELRNVGMNNPKFKDKNIEAMSQEELKKLYETELLKEKYGDDYEKMTNTTYKDYLNENKSGDQNKQNNDNNPQNSDAQSNYSGPALVYVELDNKDRGQSYVHVPVFTCRDGGKVVISISINSDGTVRSASIISANSNGDSSCIGDAARSAALKSRFTPVAGGKTEGGKITYTFIQQ